MDGAVVSVRDHGPGFPAYPLDGGPQRFRTDGAGKGHGLGLTIALGQAQVIGARLDFGNPPDGGALARLTLPEYVRLDEWDSGGNPGQDGGPEGTDTPDGPTEDHPHAS
ncbi:Sensor protein CseC [Streptomyces sp. ADI98-10]|nr:Sensor protein CseC [Streptomyces sp. ADI98-10]